MALSNFNAATVADLIADINAANSAGGMNTITLMAPTTSPYVLTAVDNTTDGATGLPVIARKDTLTIIGNGDTIERSTASGTPEFRLLDVAAGASLTLEILTLQNGLAFGSGISAEGGAIYNQGTLVLSGVTVQGNIAQGSPGSSGCSPDFGRCKPQGIIPGGPAAGGGIWSGSSLTLENGTLILNNQAIGGSGDLGSQFDSGSTGGDGSGGGLYIIGGTANLTGVTVNDNNALGGQGVISGNGYGGGLYVDKAKVTLSGDSVDDNQASTGIYAVNSGITDGGGLYVAGGTLNMSGDTVDGNFAGGGPGLKLDPTVSRQSSGGGMYVAAGTVTLCNDIVENNVAISFASGGGGGIYIASGATVYIDTSVVDTKDPTVVTNNTDNSGLNSSTANTDGTYVLKNC
jgi:hypothetical protein